MFLAMGTALIQHFRPDAGFARSTWFRRQLNPAIAVNQLAESLKALGRTRTRHGRGRTEVVLVRTGRNKLRFGVLTSCDYSGDIWSKGRLVELSFSPRCPVGVASGRGNIALRQGAGVSQQLLPNVAKCLRSFTGELVTAVSEIGGRG